MWRKNLGIWQSYTKLFVHLYLRKNIGDAGKIQRKNPPLISLFAAGRVSICLLAQMSCAPCLSTLFFQLRFPDGLTPNLTFKEIKFISYRRCATPTLIHSNKTTHFRVKQIYIFKRISNYLSEWILLDVHFADRWSEIPLKPAKSIVFVILQNDFLFHWSIKHKHLSWGVCLFYNWTSMHFLKTQPAQLD